MIDFMDNYDKIIDRELNTIISQVISCIHKEFSEKAKSQFWDIWDKIMDEVESQVRDQVRDNIKDCLKSSHER